MAVATVKSPPKELFLRGNKITIRKNGTRRVQRIISSPSMTEQSHLDEVNINSIMKRARLTGMVPQRAGSPLYGDFTSASDFHDMQNKVMEAHDSFRRLPAVIRNQFNNDPGELIAYLDNPENLEGAIELGLVDPKTQTTDELKEAMSEASEGSPGEKEKETTAEESE